MNLTDQLGQAPTNDTLPMTPTIHKIADTKPELPCWAWNKALERWERICPTNPLAAACICDLHTHFCYYDTRPTVTPEAEPPREKSQPVPTCKRYSSVSELCEGTGIAAPRPACDCVEKVAEEIARDLFTCGDGERAERLVMETRGRAGMAGWCESAVRYCVAAILRKHFGSEADELRRRDEEKNAESADRINRTTFEQVLSNRNEWQARAEKAEASLKAANAELAEYKTANDRISEELKIAESEVAALKAERDSITDRCLEINAALNDAITKIGQIPSSDIGTDYPLAQLQQMLHRVLYKENAADKIVADLRAQLAASEQRLKEAEETGKCVVKEIALLRGQASSDLNPGEFTRGWKAALDSLLAVIDAARATSSTGGVKP